MPKRTQILLSITAILGFFAFWSISKESTRDTVGGEDAGFAVADSGSVNKIVLESNGKNTTLSFNQRDWVVNNNYRGDANRVNNLLSFIYNVQIKKPVYKEQVNKVKNSMQRFGLSLTLFNGDKQMRKYTLLPDSADPNTLDALMDGHNNPYEVYLPGYENATAGIFSTEALDWKDKTLFNSRIGDILQLKVGFAAAPANNYEIVNQNGKYAITDMGIADSLRLYSYLQLYQNVGIRTYLTATEKPIGDSLAKHQPAFTISLTDKFQERTNSINIYFTEGQKGQLYAQVGKTGEWVTIRPSVFEYLLQKRSFFEKQTKTTP